MKIFILGLQNYFYRNDVSTYTATVTMHTPAKVKNNLNSGRPVLLHINTTTLTHNPSDTSGHIVLCYAYWETNETTYYIVNNTWGSNSVYICWEDVPTNYEMLYIY